MYVWLIPLLMILTLVGMVSILWTHWKGAPWLPSSLRKVRRMLEMAEVGPEDVVYDLGCGDGRTLILAARRGARAVGIEIDPLRYLWCQLLITALGLRGRVQIQFGDFFHKDLRPATVVTCYLLCRIRIKSWNANLKRNWRQDTRIVSNDFLFTGLTLVAEDADHDIRLYHPVGYQVDPA
jgi:predicted RNA methylase